MFLLSTFFHFRSLFSHLFPCLRSFHSLLPLFPFKLSFLPSPQPPFPLILLFGILSFLQTSCSYIHHCIILIFDPGADSGIVISPGVLPPLVKPPLQISSQKEETDITFGSPLTEIPVDDIKSFYRSEIQYVNFS